MAMQLRPVERGRSNQPRGNAWGVLALLGAIVALFMCWLPILGLGVALFALLVSAAGMSRARKTGGDGSGTSVAGLVISIIATVVSGFVSIPLLVVGGAMATVIATSDDSDYLEGNSERVPLDLNQKEVDKAQPSETRWSLKKRPDWVDTYPEDKETVEWLKLRESEMQTMMIEYDQYGIDSFSVSPNKVVADIETWFVARRMDSQEATAAILSEYFTKKGYGGRIEFWASGGKRVGKYVENPTKPVALYTRDNGYEYLQKVWPTR